VPPYVRYATVYVLRSNHAQRAAEARCQLHTIVNNAAMDHQHHVTSTPLVSCYKLPLTHLHRY
jgi:hypothetical protein